MTFVERVPYTIVSNNAKPDTTPAWDSGKKYQPGEHAIYNGKIYACAISNTGKRPDISINEWSKMGDPNPTKFQDEFVNTQTKNGQDALEIVLNIVGSFANSLALFNMDGRKVTVYDRHNNIIYEKALTTRDVISSWWQYFFGGSFSFRNDIWFIGKIDYSGNVKFVIEPNEKGANLGHLVIGKKVFLGHTLWEPEISTIDYSKKITNDWGNTYFRKGKTAKYADMQVVLPTQSADFVKKTLEKAVGEPNLFIGDERDKGFESLTIFGSVKDATITLPNTEYSEMSISIEGII